MRRVARRLDRNAGQIEPRRQRALGHEIVDRRQHQPPHIVKNIGHG